ncbi:MAG: hypothetical protein IIA67_02395 [Planctomycetes bacterium]|nr:hypothetical protein [Planctomycetota bacterium]
MSSSQVESTSVRLPCPQCDQLLSIREAKIGRKVRCPNCKAVLVVPTHEAAAEAMAEHLSRAETIHDVDPFAEMVVYDDAPLTYDTSYDEPDEKQQSAEVDRDRVSISRSVIYGQGILIAAVALVAFIMGFFIGHLADTDPDKEAAVVDRGPTTIYGHLAHRDAAGKAIGDDGAVVIVLPHDIKDRFDGHLATAGLSPDEQEPNTDATANRRAIANLGGVYCRTDDNGNFHFKLSPGKYYVLQISHNADRGPSDSGVASDKDSMGDLLADVDILIGTHKYRWRSGVDIAHETRLDYSFE